MIDDHSKSILSGSSEVTEAYGCPPSGSGKRHEGISALRYGVVY